MDRVDDPFQIAMELDLKPTLGDACTHSGGSVEWNGQQLLPQFSARPYSPRHQNTSLYYPSLHGDGTGIDHLYQYI